MGLSRFEEFVGSTIECEKCGATVFFNVDRWNPGFDCLMCGTIKYIEIKGPQLRRVLPPDVLRKQNGSMPKSRPGRDPDPWITITVQIRRSTQDRFYTERKIHRVRGREIVEAALVAYFAGVDRDKENEQMKLSGEGDGGAEQ